EYPAKDTHMTRAKSSFLIVLIVFFILALIWPTSLTTSQIFLNQRRAMLSIRDLSTAEHKYAAQRPGAGYACNLNDLSEQGLVDGVLASGTRNGYHFEIRCLQNSGPNVMGYTITAVPVSPGTTGKYAVCADQRGEVWYSENGLASDCLAMRKPVERKYVRSF
ncbi:MAG TPA: hypothetical protein VHM88_19660, partial [Candidatus Acidoferrales bacterium]|nr:hypothetical protein [Candidatus Acidoferrales bacterium]